MKIIYIIHSRFDYYSQTTIGDLRVDGVHFCYTLEDTVRGSGIKVKEYTAIPENSQDGYKVAIRYSPGLKREVVVLYTEDDKITINKDNVSFKYCYAHGGNTHKDTEGCVIVAHNRSGNVIQGTAEKELFNIVKQYINSKYEVRWIIRNEPQSE